MGKVNKVYGAFVNDPHVPVPVPIPQDQDRFPPAPTHDSEQAYRWFEATDEATVRSAPAIRIRVRVVVSDARIASRRLAPPAFLFPLPDVILPPRSASAEKHPRAAATAAAFSLVLELGGGCRA